ncbi:MAG: hypothetical protein ACD_6C00748G0002 [uncultured bacterium]|nr:MAG: hypothetical protein ACD_6C00748G0002 [uncultured bacterium]
MQKEIVVIGGGPGGYVAAIRGAQLGAKVTLIERHKIGGTCLNYGCIPTKTLYKNAEILNTLKHIEDFGISTGAVTIDVEKIQARKAEVVTQLVGGIEQLLKIHDVNIIWGNAEFLSANDLKVTLENGEIKTISCENIILASGSKPQMPPIEGIHLEGVLTSKEILEFKKVPEKLLIIGGGVIGMEFAGIFSAMGSEVTVVEYADQILGSIDSEISKRFASGLKKKGIEVHKSTKVTKIEKTETGLTVYGETKKGEVVFEATEVLMSTGRSPVIEGLNLASAEIEYNRCGIIVDEHFRTTSKNVYAIGDVNGKLMLAHAASHQGIAAVDHIMGVVHHGNHEVVPGCIFVFPEISTVGMSEDEAAEKGIEIKKSKFMFGANGKALSIGEPEGFVKVISDMNDIIIGVHIMGPHASDLIHEGALAITSKLHVDDIAGTIHAHPTLGEAFAEATMGLKGEAIHMAPIKIKK